MNKNDCYYLGYISKVHGIKGEVVFTLKVDEPKRYKKMGSIFIEQNGQLNSFIVESVSFKNELAIVKLEKMNAPEIAKTLVGSQLYMSLTFLPKLTGKAFYFHDVIGYKVVDANAGDIGIIESVLEYPGQNILQIKKNEKQILIPVNPDFIDKIDHENKILHVIAPKGLIDVYLK